MGRQIITNKYNLPQTIFDACKHDTHRVSGDISVTQLIDGPRVRILKRMNDYESDVSEMLYAMMGTALHHILERANISEERKRAFILTAETIISKAEEIQAGHPDKAEQLKRAANYIFGLIPVFFGELDGRYVYEQTLRLDFGRMVLYGTFDLYDKVTGILYDYKFCSVYNYTYPEARKKWERQTNTYSYMLEQNGYKVNGIKVIAFFRDWSEFGMVQNPHNYPPSQVMEINIPLYSMEDRLDYIQKRLQIHYNAEQGDIIDCTGEDRWSQADVYKIKTPKSKKAIRVFETKAEAVGWIQENRHKYNEELYTDFVPGESKRCAKYCAVAKFCPQYKLELETRNNKTQQ